MRSATSSDPLKALFAVQASRAFTPQNILVASAVPDWLTQLKTPTLFPRCTARIFARLRRDGRPHPAAQYFPPPTVRGPDSGAAVGSAAGMTDCAGSAFLLASRKGAPHALLHNAQPRLCKNRRPRCYESLAGGLRPRSVGGSSKHARTSAKPGTPKSPTSRIREAHTDTASSPTLLRSYPVPASNSFGTAPSLLPLPPLFVPRRRIEPPSLHRGSATSLGEHRQSKETRRLDPGLSPRKLGGGKKIIKERPQLDGR